MHSRTQGFIYTHAPQSAPRKGLLVFFLALAALSLAACSNDNAKEAPRTGVRYMTVEGETITLTKELPGRVSAFTVSEVRPQVGGIIKSRLFEEGADVKAGQVLYEIDPELYQAAYNNAKANLERAEANLVSAGRLAERYGKIVKTDAISKQEYDDAVAGNKQAKAEVNAAREALETARINLAYTKITSPVSGRIGRSFVTPGALVTQHQADALAVVQQLSPVYVDVTESSVELLNLRRALTAGHLLSAGKDSAKVQLKLEDGTPYAKNSLTAKKGDKPEWIEGELKFSDVTVDQSTGVVTIRATFDNPDNVLLPNMYVRAVIREGVSEGTILIPQKALQRDNKGNPYVYILTKKQPQSGAQTAPQQGEAPAAQLGEEDFFVERRTVSIGRSVGNNWLVTSGLKPGELLMVDGHMKARPGSLVTGELIGGPAASRGVAGTGATVADGQAR